MKIDYDRLQLFKATSASIISSFGATTFSFALSLKLLQTTGSAFGYGTSLFIGPIIGLVISPIVGKIIDKYSRKRISVIAELFLILLLSSYLVVYNIETNKTIYFNAIILVCLINVAARFFNLSFLSAIPQIVSKKRRQRLNSLQTTGIAVSNIIAAPIAGFLFGNIDFKLIILLQIVTEVITLLITLRISFNYQAVVNESQENPEQNYQGSLLKLMKSNINLVSILVSAMILNIANVSLQIGIPYVVINVLHNSATISGNIQGIFSFGVLLGGVIISSITLKNVFLFTKRVYWTFAILLCLLGILLTIIPQYTLVVFMVFELLLGIANTISDPPMFTYIQNIVPAQLLGRVNTFVYTTVQILNPVGVAIYSFMFSVMDYTLVYLINGLLVIVGVYFSLVVLRKKNVGNNYE